MTKDQIIDQLDSQLERFHPTDPAEDVYSHLNHFTEQLVISERPALLEALRDWLGLRSEPRTMLAVDIAASHGLGELRPEIEGLLADVQRKKVFKTYYERPIRKALEKLPEVEIDGPEME